MRFHYVGKFNGDENSLPQREHEPGAVQFKEANDIKKLSNVLTIFNGIFFVILLGITYLISGHVVFGFWGLILGYICLVPHEFLHAIWFKEDVYMYTNLKQGMLFVVGQEDFSKTRFCLMSLFPNIVLGFIPFIIYIINPNLEILGELGVFSIASGVGDYFNVFNALTQMPKGAKTYLSGMHSYWYKQ